MAKPLLLFAALLINLGLFSLMYYLVAAEQPISHKVLPALQVQFVELPQDDAVVEKAESLPSLPELPPMPPLPAVATTALPTVPKLPDLPDIKLPTLPPSLPELALDMPPYLGEMAAPPAPPVAPAQPITPAEPAQPITPAEPAHAKPTTATEPTRAPATLPTQAVATDTSKTLKPPRIVQANRNLLPLLRTEPQYPSLARRRGIEGRIEVEFLINTQGAVEEAQVMLSEPEGVFDEAALQAVRQWKFAPRYIDGKPVYQRARQVIEFKLR